MKTRVVITGIGLLGDYGIGKDSFMRFLSGCSSAIALQEIDFDAYIDTSLVRRADYISRCALVAATLSLKDAGFTVSKEKAHKIGAILGTVHGALDYSLEYHSALVLGDPKLVSPLFFSDSVVNAAVSHISTVLGIRGYATTINGYCSVIQALQLGVDFIQQGILDICLIGGADINNDFLTKAYIGCLKDPELIMGNFGGSGFFVIESLDHAEQRKARIYAQIGGCIVTTASYLTAKRNAVSPLYELAGNAPSEGDCLLSFSYDDEDSLRRKGLFLRSFKGIEFDCSNIFKYGFSAAEAFQLALAVLGINSLDCFSVFKEASRIKNYIDHLLVMRTTLAATNACVLLSRYPASGN